MAYRKGYFNPWKGKYSPIGIGGNTILVVGVQHWCDPKQWNCPEKNPQKCLVERDKACSAWIKEAELKYADGQKNCPVYTYSDIIGDKDCDKCDGQTFRFLHCETNISVVNHIFNKENKPRPNNTFILLFKALYSLFKETFSDKFKIGNNIGDFNFEQKLSYWDCIMFTNFIQHYTMLKNVLMGLEGELSFEKDNNFKNMKYCMEQFKKENEQLKGPDIIIVLQDEGILEEIMNWFNTKDAPKEYYNKYHLVEKRANEFYVLARENSNLYKKKRTEDEKIIMDFIKSKLKKKERDTTRKIFFLARFLMKKKEEKKNKRKYRGIVLSFCPPDIQKFFEYREEDGHKDFKDGNFNSFFSDFKKKYSDIDTEIGKEVQKYENEYKKWCKENVIRS